MVDLQRATGLLKLYRSTDGILVENAGRVLGRQTVELDWTAGDKKLAKEKQQLSIYPLKGKTLRTLIDFGQAASHSLSFVQLPKPRKSCAATIFRARSLRSGWPCGRCASWLALALVNSMAEAFLQLATQAP